METTKVLEELKVKLTPARRIEIGAEIAEALETIERAEAELADLKRAHKQQVEGLEARIKSDGQDLRQGYEWSEVEVEETPVENWMVARRRLDTGEALDPRPMTERERQKELELQAVQAELDEDPALVDPETGEALAPSSAEVLAEGRQLVEDFPGGEGAS